MSKSWCITAIVIGALWLIDGSARAQRVEFPTPAANAFPPTTQPVLPPLDLPEDLRYEEVLLSPRPRLAVATDKHTTRIDQLCGELSFEYHGSTLAYGQPDRGIVQAAERRVLLRNHAAENAAEQRLRSLGWRWGTSGYGAHPPRLELESRHLPAVVAELVAEGFCCDEVVQASQAPVCIAA